MLPITCLSQMHVIATYGIPTLRPRRLVECHSTSATVPHTTLQVNDSTTLKVSDSTHVKFERLRCIDFMQFPNAYD
jgi:hypothetical protein